MAKGGHPAELLAQGRYIELLSELEPFPEGGTARAKALTWAVRCRLEQGYVRAATDLLRETPVDTAQAGEAGAALRLWQGFIGLYDGGDRLFQDVLTEFCALCRELGRAGAGASALAADLLSRAETMRFTLSGRGPQHRGPVVAGLAGAAEGYRRAGLAADAVGALRRAASFAADGLRAERARARTLLDEARTEAAAGGLGLAEASAELALAEMDLREVLDGDEERDRAEVLGQFDALAAKFRAGGHAFGDALVGWAVARWLLVYGVAEGLELARTAARGFAAADVPSSEQRVWAALNSWYLVHGDPAGSREARAQEARLTELMGFGLAAEVRALDEANQAFRSGDIARARSLLGRRSRTSSGMQAANRLVLATSTNAVGLRAEARELVEGVIAELSATGGSVVLGEALTVLAMMEMGRDDDRAAELLAEAAGVAHAAESPAEEAKYRALLAWARVVRRRAEGAAPIVDAAAVAEFDEAERLLTGQRSLEAGGELARVYQFRAQAAFLSSDWNGCGTWLTKAETTARTFGLLPDLAFILCYQGLVMIEVARRTGPASYDFAASRLDESRELLGRVELPAFAWQAGFYRALCDIEAARWPDTPPEHRAGRLTQASGLMEESSALIDRLRESSERGAADQRQQVWMAFAVDKQTFYTQGFQLAWDARAEPAAAWQWLERMKGRALMDALSENPFVSDKRPGAERSRAAQQDLRVRAEPPDFAEVRALLAAEERAAQGRRVVVAEYLCAPERTLLFGARADWAEPRVRPVRLDYAALRRFAASTFRAPGGVSMMRDLMDGGMAAWHMFAPLLAPLADWSEPDDVIYLVPHGLLHDLPLHTLPLQGVPLIERNPVCYVPASAVLRHTLGGPALAGNERAPAAAVFGDARGDLRHARQEAEAVAAMFGVTAELGESVTRDRVLEALETAGVVHIAGHGRLSTGDGFASRLDLAGREVLLAGDLLGRRSRTGLAVLSGCETGVSEQRPGDEVVGFIRALLLGGVRSIVASQWRVADASTQDLLCGFHRTARDRELPLAEALRQAVREIRKDRRYGHLYHWGGFALVGSWR